MGSVRFFVHRARVLAATVLAATALAGALLVLAACSPAPTPTIRPDAASPAPGEPRGHSAGDLSVIWADGGRRIVVISWGSSSPMCQPRAEPPTAEGQQIEVWLGIPADAADMIVPCAEDVVPRAVTFAVPQGVDVTQDVEVTIRIGERVERFEIWAFDSTPR